MCLGGIIKKDTAEYEAFGMKQLLMLYGWWAAALQNSTWYA